MTHPAVAGAGERLREAGNEIERRGLEVRCVSGGGTPGAFRIHEGGMFTELRAGTYVFGDWSLAAAGVIPLEDSALRVVATVVSRPTRDRRFSTRAPTLSSDLAAATGDAANGLVAEYSQAVFGNLSEEHGILDVSACERRPEIGEVVTIVPNHACAAVNLHDQVALHRLETEVELAPIPARGLVR